MACAESGNVIPLSLQPAVQHTLDCIRRPYQTPLEVSSDATQTPSHTDLPGGQDPASSVAASQEEEEQVALDEAWQYLAELLCEQDSWAAGVGQTWLYQLLTEAADQHLAHLEHQSQQAIHPQSDDNGYPMSPGMSRDGVPPQLGLLPHPLGGPPKADAPAHLSNQPELTQLLREVLSYHTDQVTTGSCFVAVVKRLLLHLKLKCSITPAGHLQHHPQASSGAPVGSLHYPNTHKADLSSTHKEAGRQEDLLASTVDPGMASMQSAHSMPSGQSSSASAGGADTGSDPLAALHPHLMRTSPALNWGRPPQTSATTSQARLADSDDEQERTLSTDATSVDALAGSIGHTRTMSDPRGLFNSAVSADVSVAERQASSAETSKQDAGAEQRAGVAGGGSRALSSVLSTAELTGILTDGQKQEGGIVLHDGPVWGRNAPDPPADVAGILHGCLRTSSCSNADVGNVTVHVVLSVASSLKSDCMHAVCNVGRTLRSSACACRDVTKQYSGTHSLSISTESALSMVPKAACGQTWQLVQDMLYHTKLFNVVHKLQLPAQWATHQSMQLGFWPSWALHSTGYTGVCFVSDPKRLRHCKRVRLVLVCRGSPD